MHVETPCSATCLAVISSEIVGVKCTYLYIGVARVKSFGTDLTPKPTNGYEVPSQIFRN